MKVGVSLPNHERHKGMEQKILAKKLRKIREDKGITQQQAADALGIPRTAMTQIENANRNISTLELSKLAELYHCTVGELMDPKEKEDAFICLQNKTNNLISLGGNTITGNSSSSIIFSNISISNVSQSSDIESPT